MSLKSLNITNWLIFVIIYIVGLQIGAYVADMFSIAGYFASAVSLSLVFVIAAFLLAYKMTVINWLLFIAFGFISVMIGQWVASTMALSGIILSFITGTILYFILTQFSKPIQQIIKPAKP